VKFWIKTAISCIVVLCLVFGAVCYCGEIFKPIFIGDAYNAIHAFHSIPKNSVEVMIYGSSHAWKGIDAAHMYKEYGIAAYNYGCNWQHINTSALFFKDSLRTQSPKVILIEAFNINNVLMNTGLNGEILYTSQIDWFDGKAEYLRQCFGSSLKGYLGYFFPFVYFHENWSTLNQWNFMNPTDNYGFTNTMGYLGSTEVVFSDLSDPETFEQQPLCNDAISILDEIVSICKERGIEIVFYTAPYEGTFHHADAVRTYAAENGCAYIDFFECLDEAGLSGETDFRDEGHLNDSGSQKIAAYLGRFLSENYSLTDMREQDDSFWKQQLG